MTLKQVYELTPEGFIQEIYVANVVDGVILDEDKQGFIIMDHPPFYKPRWVNGEWIEGATQEEIDEITKVEPQPPTEMELLKNQISGNTDYLLDVDFRLLMVEMGI